MGLSQDGRGSVEAVGSTAAHELGHIFSMDHDTPGKSLHGSASRSCLQCKVQSKLLTLTSYLSWVPSILQLMVAVFLKVCPCSLTGCTCTDPSGDCIMAASSGRLPPVQWSSCSRDFIATGFREDNLNSCLGNAPLVTVGDPTCGNGIREGDEICDCGSPEVCNIELVLYIRSSL